VSHVLILKVVRTDNTSHNGFTWPTSGPVVPEVWSPRAECGNGLHGWLRGEGSYRHSFMAGNWIVFRCKAEDVVSLDGGEKVKAKEGEVVYHGTREGAVAYLKEHGALTDKSDPGWCCFTETQLRELAYRSANRALRKHAPAALRAVGQEALALRMEAIPQVVDRDSAKVAQTEGYAVRDEMWRIRSTKYDADAAAAAAAAYAAYAAAADAAAAAYAAADAAADAAAADAAAAAYAAYAADAAADAAEIDWRERDRLRAEAKKAEAECVRLDKLDLLGLLPKTTQDIQSIKRRVPRDEMRLAEALAIVHEAIGDES
jgi:hypothetical protein